MSDLNLELHRILRARVRVCSTRGRPHDRESTFELSLFATAAADLPVETTAVACRGMPYCKSAIFLHMVDKT